MKIVKKCKKCGIIKSLSEFYKCETCIDKHRPECKKCRNEYTKKHYLVHKQEIQKKYQAYRKKWRQENSEKIRIYDKKYYQMHREKILAQNRKYYYEHPEYRQTKTYHQRNNERAKKYYLENRKEARNKYKEYIQSLKGKLIRKKSEHKRRALKQSCQINNLTTNQIKNILNEAQKCAICNKKFNKNRKKTLDHIIPISKGGNNTLMNIQTVCSYCNSVKGTKDYTEFTKGQLLMFI